MIARRGGSGCVVAIGFSSGSSRAVSGGAESAAVACCGTGEGGDSLPSSLLNTSMPPQSFSSSLSLSRAWREAWWNPRGR